VIVAPGLSVAGGLATLDAGDVTDAWAGCGIPGTLAGGGASSPCPQVAGSTLGAGTHAFGIALTLADGSSLSAGATWQLPANTEP